MCGIFGIAGEGPLEAQLRRSVATLTHRGPDAGGFYVSPGIALGHRRLSIIDLEGGKQPMFNEDGTKAVVFNGEIYNFPELRDELLAKGHRFATRSDTETILHAYEEWGEACVERMAGMFAFAVWDEREKTLFLARDRLGIKPLFIADYGGKFYFASEIKAILADPAFPQGHGLHGDRELLFPLLHSRASDRLQRHTKAPAGAYPDAAQRPGIHQKILGYQVRAE